MTDVTGRPRLILAATDLAPDSDLVIEAAGQISHLSGAGVVLLHVLESRAGRAAGEAGRRLLERAAPEAERALEAQQRRLEEGGGRVEEVAVDSDGPAHERILRLANDMGVELLVVGSHARGGRGRFIGSTADRLLRTSPAPCFVVRGPARLPLRRAAVLTDFSKPARVAVRLAAGWCPFLCAGEPTARLDLLHVADPALSDIDPRYEARLQAKLAKEVREVAADVEGRSGRVEGRLLWGTHPVDEILLAAEEDRYDLLVLGTHGAGRVRRVLLGSVAMAVAQSAPCPVLVVPPTRRGKRS